MKRRTLLATVGSGTVVSAGCLGNDIETDADDSDTPSPSSACDADETYETCHHLIIPYASFPDPLQCEVDAALEANGYTATGRFLLEDAMDVEHAYVRRDDATYEPSVSESDETDERTLSLVERGRLTRRRVHELRVENATDERRTVAITIVREGDDETVVDETLALEAGDREKIAVSDVLGRYECSVSDDRVLEETVDSRLGEYVQFDALVVDEEFSLVESTADVAPCPWER
ncbi:hypothetical protein [Natronorubrum halophilum]|uniref:hypothetical protein n=1 Tax=Natronorubrum halophilum TaxID=1702106 RepID=UPI000EF6D151|nr:hypothetical protein [Natronorubrum halophilum]